MKSDPLLKNSTLYFERSDRSSVSIYAKHIHNAFELYYMESGSCEYFADSNIYHIQSGDVILIPQGLLHGTSYSSPQRVRTVVNFSSVFVPSSIFQKLNSAPLQIRNENLQEDIRFYLKKIEENYQSELPNAQILLALSLESLLLILCRNEQTPDKVNFQQLVCGEILQYIQDHYMEHITLSDIAKKFMMSESYTSKLLKKECGIGFCKYLMLIRLQNARKMLLADPKLSVTDVAYACGFSDSNYFSVCFKKAFEMVPRSIRNSAKE